MAGPAACSASLDLVDQSYVSGGGTGDVWNPNAFRANGDVSNVGLAQTFTVARSGLLDRIQIQARGRDLLVDVPLEIHVGTPGGPIVAIGDLPMARLRIGGWIDVPIAPVVRVRSGDVLAIVLPPLHPDHSADSGQAQPTITWITGRSDGYDPGNGMTAPRVGVATIVSWDSSGYDRTFRTFSCALPDTSTGSVAPARGPASPWLPSTVGFVVFAIALLGPSIRRRDRALAAAAARASPNAGRR